MDALCVCELKKTATNVVPEKGSVDLKVMFIGEVLGKREDEIGELFVGVTGKFLSELFAIIDLKREDSYIINIVKYCPPNNRDSFSEEVVSC